MRKLFSSPWIWGLLAAVSLAVHILWARRTADYAQAARCGATWIVFAGLIIWRPIIRRGGCRNWYLSTKVMDCGQFPPTSEELEEEQQANIDARCVQLFGPILAVFGTILWAYGDLIANAL
jgi:hypothetical protein